MKGEWVIDFAPETSDTDRARVRELYAIHNAAAQTPRGSDLLKVIFQCLSGRDGLAKLERGIYLMARCPYVLGFVNLLDVATPSATRLLVLQAVWAVIRDDAVIGVDGSDPERLTIAEAATVEDTALEFGIPLAARR